MSGHGASPVMVVVRSEVDPSHEDEFNRWYDERHLPDVLRCPGFRSAARYRAIDGRSPAYVAVYLVDAESALDTPELRAISGFAHLTPHVTYERRVYGLLRCEAAGEA